MLKHALLASAMLIAAPAIAQTTPTDGQDKPATPTTSTTAPATATPPASTTPQPTPPATTAAPTAQAAPTPQTAPATPPADAQAATPAPADPATAATAPAAPTAPATADAATPAAPAAAAPTPGVQIADIVTKEFPSYDKNGDGKLSKAEFGAWMFALRKANDPALKDDAANKTYVAGAFATADTDKSKAVSKDELTNYLVQGQLAASKAS